MSSAKQDGGGGIQIVPLVQLVVVGVLGFLGADFVEGRDARTTSLEDTLRGVLELKLAPISEQVIELKDEVSDLLRTGMQTRAETRDRMSGIENRMTLVERELEEQRNRLERLRGYIAERSITPKSQ